jgi:hypothetical protein
VNPNSTSAPDGDGAVLQDRAEAGALALLESLQHVQSLPPVGMIGESIAHMKRQRDQFQRRVEK